MSIYRYSEWDGSQDLFGPDADELLDELGRNLMSYGDLSYALRLLQRGGIRDSQGRKLPGIQDLLQRLRQKKQSQLEKYQLSSVVEEIRQKLDNILKTDLYDNNLELQSNPGVATLEDVFLGKDIPEGTLMVAKKGIPLCAPSTPND